MLASASEIGTPGFHGGGELCGSLLDGIRVVRFRQPRKSSADIDPDLEKLSKFSIPTGEFEPVPEACG